MLVPRLRRSTALLLLSAPVLCGALHRPTRVHHAQPFIGRPRLDAARCCSDGAMPPSGQPPEDTPPPARYATPESFTSRSTARTDEEAAHAAGAGERRARLHAALEAVGFTELDALLSDPSFRGSAALRMYTSFVFPKSPGALATAEKPQRAASIASSIFFLVREQRAAAQEWLRNHDRSLSVADAQSAPHHPLYIVLDNLRSAANVGNIFRAAEAARVTEVFTCGITPTPPDSKLLKTAVGAAEYVRHSHVASTAQVVATLQAHGVAVWAVETTQGARLYTDGHMPTPLALVFGNEVIGVDTDVLRSCDAVVEIPMHGVKNSLNVRRVGPHPRRAAHCPLTSNAREPHTHHSQRACPVHGHFFLLRLSACEARLRTRHDRWRQPRRF